MRKIFMLVGAWTFLLSYSGAAGTCKNESVDYNKGTLDSATENYKDANVDYSEGEMELLEGLKRLNDTLQNHELAMMAKNPNVTTSPKAGDLSENDMIQDIEIAEKKKEEKINNIVKKWSKNLKISSINDEVFKNKKTCLHYAAANDLEEVVETLLKLGVKVNSEDQFGNTPLYYALLVGNSIKTVYLLVDAGADLEDKMVQKITYVFLRNIQTYILPQANYCGTFYCGYSYGKNEISFLKSFKESYRYYQALILVKMYQLQILSLEEEKIYDYVFNNLPCYDSHESEAINQWIIIANWLFKKFPF